MRRKLLNAVLTVWLALTFTFVLIRQMPGDVVHTLALQIQAAQGIGYDDARAVAKTMLNYDPTVPVHQQYFDYVKNLVVHGQLGYSMSYRIPVTSIIAGALPWTLLITTSALLLSFCLGTVLGAWIAWKRKTILDPLLTLYATVTQAVPDFLIALLLLMVFGLGLRWFPLRGPYGPDVEAGWSLGFALDVAWHAVLPVMSFALPAIGSWVLAMKASALTVSSEDYMHVARAKGLSDRRILLQYLVRNAILPLVSTLASSMGAMLGGAMFIESIYGYPGIGFFTRYAIATRDYTLMQGLFLLTTVGAVLANLLADAVTPLLDPRVKSR